jgi:hypothetical protein
MTNEEKTFYEATCDWRLRALKAIDILGQLTTGNGDHADLVRDFEKLKKETKDKYGSKEIIDYEV